MNKEKVGAVTYVPNIIQMQSTLQWCLTKQSAMEIKRDISANQPLRVNLTSQNIMSSITLDFVAKQSTIYIPFIGAHACF